MSWFDAIWAFAAPVLALLVRDPDILASKRTDAVLLYCLISALLSIFFYWIFDVREALPSFFSVRDSLQLVKAAALSMAVTCALVFAVTRLEGIPRSTPIIHGLVLISGLLAARAVGRLFFVQQTIQTRYGRANDSEHIVMIGANHITAAFIGLIQACDSVRSRVIAVLDDRPQMMGRSIAHVRIMGSTRALASLIDEFNVHGVQVDRVLVGGGPDALNCEVFDHLTSVCEKRAIELNFVPHIADLRPIVQDEAPQGPSVMVLREERAPAPDLSACSCRGSYRVVKRAIDLLVAAALLIMTAPLWALLSVVVLAGVGSPVLFWQQRVGQGGRSFMIYKFRTLRAPYDRNGRPLTPHERQSRIGQLLRKSHLDELPQLLNVLVGDMSLVGPRPLLPVDQPSDPSIRLTVAPGVTGWAQINGGQNISVAEKTALDEWYVRHLSFRLDLQILFLTLVALVKGGTPQNWIGDAANIHLESDSSARY